MRVIKLHRNESGLVSIIVTMIIMIVLSITVIGFAQIARREQRQTLDRQLSTGAYYAAESGINDAIKKLNADSTFTINTCAETATKLPTLGASSPSSYSCVLVGQSPTTLEYGAISTDKSQIVNISTDGGVNLDTLTISWNDKDGTSTNFNNPYPNFPPYSSPDWKSDTGVLEVSLTPTTDTTDFSRANLADRTYTAYLYPSDGGSNSTNYKPGAANQGDIVEVKCNGGGTPKKCTVDINFPAPYNNKSKYLLRLKPIYKTASVTVSGKNGANNVKFVGSQVIIDSTGKANDVLRRLQVRVPIGKEFNYPEYVLDSADSICKRLQVYPGGGSTDSSDPACAIN